MLCPFPICTCSTCRLYRPCGLTKWTSPERPVPKSKSKALHLSLEIHTVVKKNMAKAMEHAHKKRNPKTHVHGLNFSFRKKAPEPPRNRRVVLFVCSCFHDFSKFFCTQLIIPSLVNSTCHSSVKPTHVCGKGRKGNRVQHTSSHLCFLLRHCRDRAKSFTSAICSFAPWNTVASSTPDDTSETRTDVSSGERRV